MMDTSVLGINSHSIHLIQKKVVLLHKIKNTFLQDSVRYIMLFLQTISCNLLQRRWPAVCKEHLPGGSVGKLWMQVHTSLPRPESEFSVRDVPGILNFTACIHQAGLEWTIQNVECSVFDYMLSRTPASKIH